MGSLRSLSTVYGKTEFRKPDPSKPKLVLAYSGGLDTSTQLAYLANEKGFEVCAYIADLGQDDLQTEEAKEAVREKAKLSGAYSFYCEDLRKEFVEDFVFPMVAANAVYEGRYLLGTAIARPCIARKQVNICEAEGATHISHGSTGKGNDQVRFELCYLGMNPHLNCVTLWREPEYCEKFQGRQDLIDYASQFNIPVSQTKTESYSTDENTMHISFESGELEDPAFPGAKNQYPGSVLTRTIRDVMDAPDTPVTLTVNFDKGMPTSVKNEDDGTEVTGAFEIITYLNEIGGEHAIGGIDIVENRYVGLKSRGCYETPGGSILYSAHHDLEMLCLDREVMRLRDQLALKYADNVYCGYWFSPEMAVVKNSMEYIQRPVTGSATVRLYKGSIANRGRSSPNSLYNEKAVSMDEHGGFDPTASTGFIKTLSTRLIATRKRDEKLGHPW
eukprot:CAMPEP_0184521838 /NCGR_PEP_ID=MMETSP0198_2-20121128/7926_1 /TAXON_ID=1112570 /ORGANISM="Thraustochytrium sp., Strain LLF1b" /LENGTH=444 /DNA_ID=CAMNT_0026912553 /DNA_START=191 /DNA_END=1525 /DNA_ORIENTATION=-